MRPDTITYSSAVIAKACSDFWIKCVGALVLAAYSFSFDRLHEKAMIAVMVLIIMDFITGLIAAKRGGDEIKSSKIFRTVIKTLIYFILISAAHLCELAAPLTRSFLDEMVIAFLALTEMVSLLENVGKMGFAVPKKLLNKLREYRDEQ